MKKIIVYTQVVLGLILTYSSLYTAEHTVQQLQENLTQLAHNLEILGSQVSREVPQPQLLSVQPVANGSYCINFMWINRNNAPEQLYIFPAESPEELEKKYLDNIYAWASGNKHATIHIWFDSNFSSKNAIESTRALIKEHESTQVSAQIILKDVRTLPIAQNQNNQNVFSEKIPVYFRADLLRVIAAVYMVTEGKFQYFVYGDLDMKPLFEEQLFDNETLKKLEDYGIVMAEGGFLGFENGFFIISNQNKNLLEAINFVLIEPSIERAQLALEKKLTDVSNRYVGVKALQQIIYDTYTPMFHYFFYLEKKVTLRKKTNKEPYDKKRDGIRPFAPKEHPINMDLELLIENEITNLRPDPDKTFLIPTKKVYLPPAALNYS